jgi:hypothetical protein
LGDADHEKGLDDGHAPQMLMGSPAGELPRRSCVMFVRQLMLVMGTGEAE